MRRRVYNMPMLWEEPTMKSKQFYSPAKSVKRRDVKLVISREIELNCSKKLERALTEMADDITTALLKGMYDGRGK